VLPEDEEETTFAFDVPQPTNDVFSPAEPNTNIDLDSIPAVPEETAKNVKPRRARTRKELKISRHGIPYPSLPTAVVKKLASTFARSSGSSKSHLKKDTLGAIMQATEWFFEQMSEDVGAYANHAGRKTIDESDMVTLMKRQRQLNANATPFSLAQKYLPRELLQEIRMAPPPNSRVKERRPLKTVIEDDEEDGT